MPERLRAILVGAGTRAKDFYTPLCQMLTDDIGIELVGVWSRSDEKARALGEQCDVPWQTDLEQLVRQTQPHFAIHTNGEPEYGAAQARHDCAVALAIKQSAENSGIPVEVT